MRQILFISTFFLLLLSQVYALDLRILGGQSMEDKHTSREWLVRFIDPKSNLAFCTGSLMSENLVITSFKCIGSIDPKELKKTTIGHTGSKTTTTIESIYLPYEDTKEDLEIATAFRMSQTNLTPKEEELKAQKEKQDRHSQADIVIVKLAEPLVSSAYVTLPIPETIDDYYDTNDTAILLGYGVNELGVENIGIPMETNISISSKEFCDEATEEVLQKYATEEEKASETTTSAQGGEEEEMASLLICDNALGDKMRYEKSVGICAGDTGAPLIVQEINERNVLNMVQIGLASGFLKDGDSLDCGQNTGYYANLSFHAEWLNLVLTGDANTSEYVKDDNLFRDPNEGFYKHIQSLEKKTWHLLGAGAAPIGLDLSKIPTERFQVYIFRDNKMHTINQLAKHRLILNLYEGFWLFMEED